MTDDAWAIQADLPGRRDLGCPEFCQRSLERSRRRRERAAARRAGLHPAGRVSLALATATVVAPAASTARAAVTANLHRGSRGSGVAAVQRALGVPADGIFGPVTRRAVIAFQAAHGLAVDGIVGPQTRAALGLLGGGHAHVIHMPASTAMAVQRALGVPADGVFGPISQAALRAFQRAHGLLVDGIPGPQSLAALGLSGASAPTGGGAATAVAAARREIGARYEFGGEGPAFDCSGLVQWAFRQAGISLPRTSYSQYGVGSPVPSNAIQAGDLVFWDTDGSGASHVGIATGPSTVISATTHGVMEHSIFGPYWGHRYVGARRL